MRIGQLAQLVGVETQTIRFYEPRLIHEGAD
ncbi:MerR family DNA-binding transcriptional regulator [Salinicola sp. NYA28a]